MANTATKTEDREKIAVWLDHPQVKALRSIADKDGVPIAEQIRRAVDQWLEKRKK